MMPRIRSGSASATDSTLGSVRVPTSTGSPLSGAAVAQEPYPATSATPTGCTPREVTSSVTFHSRVTTRLAGWSRVPSSPRPSVRVIGPVAALVLGLALWLHFNVVGGWLHAKLVLVALLFAHYVVAGRWLKGADRGGALPSTRALRIFNEVPVFGLLGVIFLVLAKPF